MHLLSKPISIIRNFVSAVEDQWSWTTRDGDFYEDVEVEDIIGKEVLIQHRFGPARLLISNLSDESLQRLQRTSIWENHQMSARPANVLLFRRHSTGLEAA